ncbi:hypothetical protein [Nostoc sp. C110]|uniref:hypothetical protein n=1 Tax=Nostoc sp. C110 TaxID=3349876 RepID=UPI00370D1652
MEELEKDLPTVIDCTTLTLVDVAPSQLAQLLAEKQDCGVEAIFPHEDTCSAARDLKHKMAVIAALCFINKVDNIYFSFHI